MSAPATSFAPPMTASRPRPRASSASACARAGVRDTTVTCSIGRTASIASRWDPACTPAPKMTRRREPALARWRVASPETAAVRSAVSAAPSTIASGACGRRVEQDVDRVDERQVSLRVPGRERHELHADAGVAERRHLEQRAGRRLEVGSQRRDGRVLFTEPRLQGVDGRGHRKPARSSAASRSCITAPRGTPPASVGWPGGSPRCPPARPPPSGSRSHGRRWTAPCSRSARPRRSWFPARGSA